LEIARLFPHLCKGFQLMAMVSYSFQDASAVTEQHAIGRASPHNFYELQIMPKERGLSDLGRGWHTPDPSPRASSGLPRCAAKDLIVNYAVCETASTRTPSPSSSHDCETGPSTCRFRTPSPHRDYYSTDARLSSLPPMPFPLWPSYGNVPDGYIAEPSVMCSPCVVPDEMFEPCSSWADTTDDAAISIDSDESAKIEDASLPSKGSLGHPFACAEACKYVRKARGCKDGALCDRCHLCVWKQSTGGKHNEVRSQRRSTTRAYPRR